MNVKEAYTVYRWEDVTKDGSKLYQIFIQENMINKTHNND